MSDQLDQIAQPPSRLAPVRTICDSNPTNPLCGKLADGDVFEFLPAWRWTWATDIWTDWQSGSFWNIPQKLINTFWGTLLNLLYFIAGTLWKITSSVLKFILSKNYLSDIQDEIAVNSHKVLKGIGFGGGNLSLWYAMGVMALFLFAFRVAKGGNAMQLARGLLATVIPLAMIAVIWNAAFLESQVTAADRTKKDDHPPGSVIGSPVWLYNKSQYVTGLTGDLLLTFSEQMTNELRSGGTTYCDTYIAALENLYRAGRYSQDPGVSTAYVELPVYLSRLWQDTYLYPYSAAQFGPGTPAVRGACLLAEEQSSNQQEILAVWDVTCYGADFRGWGDAAVQTPDLNNAPFEANEDLYWSQMYPLLGCDEDRTYNAFTAAVSRLIFKPPHKDTDDEHRAQLRIYSQCDYQDPRASDKAYTRDRRKTFNPRTYTSAYELYKPGETPDWIEVTKEIDPPGDAKSVDWARDINGEGTAGGWAWVSSDIRSLEKNGGAEYFSAKVCTVFLIGHGDDSGGDIGDAKIIADPNYFDGNFGVFDKAGFNQYVSDKWRQWFYDNDCEHASIQNPREECSQDWFISNQLEDDIRSQFISGEDFEVSDEGSGDYAIGGKEVGMDNWVRDRAEHGIGDVNHWAQDVLTDSWSDPNGVPRPQGEELNRALASSEWLNGRDVTTRRVIFGVLALVTAWVYALALIGLATGALLSQFILMMIFIALPLILLVIAAPFDVMKGMPKKVLRLTIGALFANYIFMAILMFMIVLIVILREVILGLTELGSWEQALGMALGPLLAIKGVGWFGKSVGVDITSFKGAIATTSGMAFAAMQPPDASSVAAFGRKQAAVAGQRLGMAGRGTGLSETPRALAAGAVAGGAAGGIAGGLGDDLHGGLYGGMGATSAAASPSALKSVARGNRGLPAASGGAAGTLAGAGSGIGGGEAGGSWAPKGGGKGSVRGLWDKTRSASSSIGAAKDRLSSQGHRTAQFMRRHRRAIQVGAVVGGSVFGVGIPVMAAIAAGKYAHWKMVPPGIRYRNKMILRQQAQRSRMERMKTREEVREETETPPADVEQGEATPAGLAEQPPNVEDLMAQHEQQQQPGEEKPAAEPPRMQPMPGEPAWMRDAVDLRPPQGGKPNLFQ